MLGYATQKPPADQRPRPRHNSSRSFSFAGGLISTSTGSGRPLGPADLPPQESQFPVVRPGSRSSQATQNPRGSGSGEIRILGSSTTLVLEVDFVPAAQSYDSD